MSGRDLAVGQRVVQRSPGAQRGLQLGGARSRPRCKGHL